MSDTVSLGVSTLFLVLAGVSLRHLLRARRWPQRVEHTLHLAMAVAMAAMPWPSWSAVPLAGWLILFGASAAWFAWEGVRAAGRAGLTGPGDALRVGNLLMAVVMVWMVLAMAAGDRTTAGHVPLTGALAWIGLVLVAALLVVATLALVDDGERIRSRRLRGFAAVEACSSSVLCLAMGLSGAAMVVA